MNILAHISWEARDLECIHGEPRVNLERFDQNDFKKATKQILKNYLLVRDNISVKPRNPCRKLYKKMVRNNYDFEESEAF